MSDYVNFTALGKILLVSLATGGGLVALFGVGLRGFSAHMASDGPGNGSTGSAQGALAGPLGLVVGVVCMVLVTAGAATGLYVVLAT